MFDNIHKIVWCALLCVSWAGCSFTERITDGAVAYERRQYFVATQLLKNEFDKTQSANDKAQKAWLLGQAYRQMNDNPAATKWYKEAYELGYGLKALEAYAYGLKMDEEYAAAMRTYVSLGEQYGNRSEYRQKADECTRAEQWKNEPDKAVVVTPFEHNSAQSDYGAVFYSDSAGVAQQIVFASDRGEPTNQTTFKWTGNRFSDFYIASTDTKSVEVLDEVSSAYNDGVASFANNGNTIYYTQCGSDKKTGTDYCRIYMRTRSGAAGQWSAPVLLPFETAACDYAHPFWVEQGHKLLFASNGATGFGRYDLYASTLQADGTWSAIENLGRKINTEGDEMFPSVYADTLYFASDGHAGMGGLDIFKVAVRDIGAAPVENMRAPFNSGADDFALALLPDDNATQRKGILSSSRKGGLGYDDLYWFEVQIPTKQTIVVTPPPVVHKKDTVYQTQYVWELEGEVLEKELENPTNPNSRLLRMKPLAGAAVRINNQVVQSNEQGAFVVTLPKGGDYTVSASHEGYFAKTEIVSLSNPLPTDTKRQDDVVYIVRTQEIRQSVSVVLDRIYKNQEITLEDIYYDYNKWDIRSDAQPTLNRLADLLQQNPSIRIQLSSHTDCRGSSSFNEDLSQKRAQSAVDYLISRGVEANRMTAKGYGEQVPAIACVCTSCTDTEHQANRRTTFKVLE